MVAKIASGKSIRGILHYNENKVSAGVAELIMASGIAGEIDRMGFEEKLRRFKRLTELNGKVKTNAIHISLNFHPDEKLDEGKLQRIFLAYMERIGFGEQPFLVYAHRDSAHPHVHIATTNIQRDGSRIDINKIGFRLSESARKAIEIEFGLVRAQGKKSVVRAADAPATYGQKPTRQVIGNLVTRVMQEYSYSSFGDFRTLLEHFGVIADRGEKDSRKYEKKGLQFFLMDKHGKATGVPVKASDLYAKPTMVNLEKRFEKNKLKKEGLKPVVRAKLDVVLAGEKRSAVKDFMQGLKQQQVEVILRQSAEGKLFGVTFIDLEQRVIFNSSELGKGYGAKTLEERLGGLEKVALIGEKYWSTDKDNSVSVGLEKQRGLSAGPLSMLEVLTQRELVVGPGLLGKSKKRKKKVQSQDLSR